MLRVKQVAERLNLSESKVYELVDQGKLGHHRMDGAIRVSEEQIAEYLAGTRREPAAPRERKTTGPRLKLTHVRLR